MQQKEKRLVRNAGKNLKGLVDALVISHVEPSHHFHKISSSVEDIYRTILSH